MNRKKTVRKRIQKRKKANKIQQKKLNIATNFKKTQQYNK